MKSLELGIYNLHIQNFSGKNDIIASATRRRRNIKIPLSVGSYLEKFNIVSNDHGRMQKSKFCVSVCKTNFTDYPIQYTGLEIRFWSVKCTTVTVRYTKFRVFSFLPIKRCKRLQCLEQVYYESKSLQNAFKCIQHYIYFFKL